MEVERGKVLIALCGCFSSSFFPPNQLDLKRCRRDLRAQREALPPPLPLLLPSRAQPVQAQQQPTAPIPQHPPPPSRSHSDAPPARAGQTLLPSPSSSRRSSPSRPGRVWQRRNSLRQFLAPLLSPPLPPRPSLSGAARPPRPSRRMSRPRPSAPRPLPYRAQRRGRRLGCSGG